MAHTPGPWEFEQEMRGDGAPLSAYDIYGGPLGDDPWCVATVHGTINDARLIAAAPDLLEALKMCANFFEKNMGVLFGPDHDIPMAAHASGTIQSVKYAIRKAEAGEAGDA